jgi:hypothetical protein
MMGILNSKNAFWKLQRRLATKSLTGDTHAR